MQDRKYFGLSSVTLVIILGAAVEFALHMFRAPEYGFFFDEFYTIALSRHLAFGYVDLPPLVPLLVAFSRALLGDSLFAYHIFPALAGAGTLVFICLITKEFGGKTFAVALSALGFIIVPVWLVIDSIFCYDSIDQLVLAGFLYALVRFLHSGNRRLWILLGLIAGIACMTKMTILFLGPGFLIALLISKYRKDLLTPWPWLGAALCLIIVSPYLLWELANHWPTLEYWINYDALRMYPASLPQFLINLLVYMYVLLLPLWLVGLYRIFRRLDGVNYGFLGVMFVITLAIMFVLHSPARMLAELFMPLLAAGAVLVEDLSSKAAWGRWMRAGIVTYLVAIGVISVLLSLPILPMDRLQSLAKAIKPWSLVAKEFKGQSFGASSPLLPEDIGWDELVQDVAAVYHELPEGDRAAAGIYADWYGHAGAIDELGPKYGLPHAVSGSLTYYLWGPGYSWDVMIIIADRTNMMNVFFDECDLKKVGQYDYGAGPSGVPYIYVCREPKVSPNAIWSSIKFYR